MRIKQFLVLPNIPEKIQKLRELAMNLWFSWNWDIVKLFIRIDSELWEKSYQNPIEMLASLPQQKLEEVANDEAFLANLNRVYESYQEYISSKKWFEETAPNQTRDTIAYFSCEYGIDTGLPVYSGGLGVLSGDHLKASSDLGLPLVAIGLLYRYGYFRQFLSADGWQQERYEENDWYHMPVTLEKDDRGNPIKFSLDYSGTPVIVQIWKAMVGVTPLYLLDTNIPENPMKFREITSVLYSGDKDTRLKQEILLGIGGVRALKTLGINPAVYHMNEGHSLFLQLERLRMLVTDSGLSLSEAVQCIKVTSVFTTHTPLPAGNETFEPKLLERYLKGFVESFGMSWSQFLSLGRVFKDQESEPFGMTPAALKLSSFCNGVSKLHGEISRKMWRNIWPGLPVEEVPIGSITNGVHLKSWFSHDIVDLFDTYFGPKFTKQPSQFDNWDKVHKIPDAELWRMHQKRRERLVFFARKRLKSQLARKGASDIDIKKADEILDPRVLTIGFARRFSTYKRAFLLFKDEKRLEQLLSDPDHPVQIIIAGKAHPLDNPGKEIIKHIIDIAAQDKFRKKIVFLEDYDINVARYLVQGADVWLNNPRRPQEASGTSGMKAAVNGAINVSILDGWWCEAYTSHTGFKIGNGEEYENVDYQDELEGKFLYDVLEREVIPLFYKRNGASLPTEWITLMKNSIAMTSKDFSSHRMVRDYTLQSYLPAIEAYHLYSSNDFSVAREVSQWQKELQSKWDDIDLKEITAETKEASPKVGDVIPITMKVYLGDISPQDINVEVLAGNLNSLEQMDSYEPVTATLKDGDGSQENGQYIYESKVVCRESGRFGIAARVIPNNKNLIHNRIPKLIKWW
ncbi:MAG TPA: glycosyltransferase family 1 protein [candidate division Zixibacteria bacterium]|nr:glycosyltransferase family 1 protein [candidate division Zixibacteria bacterium]